MKSTIYKHYHKRLQYIFFFLILTIGMLFTFQSCEKEIGIEADFQKNIDDGISYQLGKKLENPYSVKNMQKALNNLRGNKKTELDTIIASHYYIKFIPIDDDELDRLDSLSFISEYPLDYEVIEGESCYRDPEVPDDQPTFQYTAVKIGEDLPNVNYEIIEELYIPEEDVEYSLKRSVSIDALVTEALRITNNLDGVDGEVKSSWRPSGTIKVWDDFGRRDVNGNFLGNMIPLKGAKVEARRWFTVYKGITDENGFYECNGTFLRPANYKIVWETDGYDIRYRYWGQAIYNGPKKEGDWDLNIGSSTDTNKSMRYATIHRAAYRYFYDDIHLLKRPGVPNKLKISYFDDKGTGVNWGNLPYNIIPNILIYGKSSTGSYHSTNALFSTTVHEIGHASHINLMGGIIQYVQVNKVIYESWANCLEWYITKIEYQNLGNVNFDVPPYSYIDNMQNWSSAEDSHTYTPLFIDIVDDYNQSFGEPTNRPDDKISIRIKLVEIGVVGNSYGFTSLKKALRDTANPTVSDEDIDLLIDFYSNL